MIRQIACLPHPLGNRLLVYYHFMPAQLTGTNRSTNNCVDPTALPTFEGLYR